MLIACAEAMVSRVNKKLLKVNGGPIDLSKSWAKSLFGHMGYVKRKVNTSFKVEPSHFEELKEQYLLNIKAAVQIANIATNGSCHELGPYCSEHCTWISMDIGGKGCEASRMYRGR